MFSLLHGRQGSRPDSRPYRLGAEGRYFERKTCSRRKTETSPDEEDVHCTPRPKVHRINALVQESVHFIYPSYRLLFINDAYIERWRSVKKLKPLESISSALTMNTMFPRTSSTWSVGIIMPQWDITESRGRLLGKLLCCSAFWRSPLLDRSRPAETFLVASYSFSE